MLKLLPNAITVSRGACGPVIMVLVIAYQMHFAAFWLFMLAIASDLVDGFVARRLNAVSSFAAVLDPLSDKVLTDFSWVALAWVGHAPVWLVVLVLSRDLLVGVFWLGLSERRFAWTPRPVGQIGVAFEGVAVAVLLFHGPWVDVHWPSVGTALGVIALALSVVPLLEYAWGD